eukprot:12891826-Alexandrium_andersonii.AAC.1
MCIRDRVALYLPPGHDRLELVNAATKWASEILDATPHRCIPVVCTDANAHLGLSKVQGIADQWVPT